MKIFTLAFLLSGCGALVVIDGSDGSGGSDEIGGASSGGGGQGDGGRGPDDSGSGAGGQGGCEEPECVVGEGWIGVDLVLDREIPSLFIATDGGAILAYDRQTGALSTLIETGLALRRLDLYGGWIFASHEEGIEAISIDGATMSRVATFPSLFSLRADIEGVSALDTSDGGRILRFGFDGGSPITLAPEASGARDLASDRAADAGPILYFTANPPAGMGKLRSVGVLSPGATVDLMAVSGAGPILHTDEGIYVASTEVGNVSLHPPVGPNQSVLADASGLIDLEVDSRSVFVLRAPGGAGEGGSILRVGRVEAKGLTVVRDDLASPIAMQVDDEHLYVLQGDAEAPLVQIRTGL